MRSVITMSTNWIKIEHWTPDKPEIHEMADTLGIDADSVLGKLIRIWIWADSQTQNGNAPRVTFSLLDRVASVAGFAQALVNVGWLTRDETGIRFSNFDRHNGETAKTRANSAKRTAKHRASVTEVSQECNAQPVTPPLPVKKSKDTLVSLPDSTTSGKQNQPSAPCVKKPQIEKPDGVDQEPWDDWLVARKAKGLGPVTSSVMKRLKTQADKLDWTVGQAIEYAASKSQGGFEASWVKNDLDVSVQQNVIDFSDPNWEEKRPR